MSMNDKEKMSQYNGVFTAPPQHVPSTKVVDGPIIGNGDVGVVVSGEPHLQKFWISKTDFWKAKRIYPNGSPCLIGGINLHLPLLTGADYASEQHLYEAEIVSTFRTEAGSVSVRSWVSANQNVLIIELSSDGIRLPVKVELWVQPNHESLTASSFNENVWMATRKFTGTDLDWPTEAVLAMRNMNIHDNEFVLNPGEKVTIATVVRTNHESDNYLDESWRSVSELTEASVTALKQQHEAWWREFWAKSSVKIGDELLEKFWYGSHYIMACCSRNKQFPPGLFGNWITTDKPEWAGDYHLNYNYQAPWWGVYSSNHIELSEPYDTPLLEYMPNGRKYAEQYLGKNGIYYDVGIGPKGFSTALSTTEASLKYENGHLFLGQKSNAALSAINMLMRFYYSYDLQYASQVAYPYLIDVANFWEDYLTFEDNRYVIYRDAIHEVPTFMDSHPDDKWLHEFEDMNPILSLGVVQTVFKGLLDMSKELGLDANRREKWSHILQHISDFPTFEREGKMIYRLTEQGRDWWDDNTLAIQHIWPAGAIGLDSDPKLLEIARNTITIINRWKDYNGFPTIFTAAARVGYDPEIILYELRRQCLEHSFPNLFIFFGGGGIECCSGVPSAINEMLMQSHEDIIRLFPVWPKHKDARFNQLRTVGAFLVSAALRNGVVGEISIVSEKGRRCKLENPWPEAVITITEEHNGISEVVHYGLTDEGRQLAFNTKLGATYTFRVV